jgi:hypothetical protein
LLKQGCGCREQSHGTNCLQHSKRSIQTSWVGHFESIREYLPNWLDTKGATSEYNDSPLKEAEWNDQELLQKWIVLRNLRSEVFKKLEIARSDKYSYL